MILFKKGNIMKLTVYSDPGHAWVKIKKSKLLELNIHDRISGYSYQRKDYAYLEEDADVSVLITKLKEHNIDDSFNEVVSARRSRIRNYCTYKPEEKE